MSLLITLIGLAILGDRPLDKLPFKIRINGIAKRRFEIIEGHSVIACYENIRCAKAFRNALEWAIFDQDMNAATALLYANKRAEEELTAGLENEEPDQHFVPA